ncbi:hypothetical protein ACJZ2D_014748 [Fusarium nematophilum]
MATYLITQATGQQSRWVISHLLEAGARVHGVAKTIVEACKKAGVESVVAATTVGTGNKSLWDDDEVKGIQLHQYFSSKAEVEDHVRLGNFQAYTILRPGVIHHDFFLPGALGNFPRLPTHGELDHLLDEGAALPYTDAHDIGKYAAAALQNPAKFADQEIELGSELLTIQEVHDILVRVAGREVPVIKRTPEELEKMGIRVFGQNFHLLANIKDLSSTTAAAKELTAKFGIALTSLEVALQRDRALVLECLPAN